MSSSILRRLAFGIAIAVLSVHAIACGGSDSDSPETPAPSTPPPSTPPPPTNPPTGGTLRIEWSQVVSAQDLRSMWFRLYVNNLVNALDDARCNPSGSAYLCSAVLPRMNAGANVLQLTAVLNGVESPRSASLTVNSSASATADADASDAEGLATAAPVCDGVQQCYDARVLATNLTDVSALTAVADGRVFFVEHGSRVRVIADGALFQEPALEVPASTRIVGMAVDESQFASTHVFYVASTQPTPDGHATLSVTRYREVAGQFGEAATIVSGLSIPAGAVAPLAVDGQGLVYVGVPAFPGRAALIESGVVLRVARDGRVPDANANSSPVFAVGFPKPTALAIDATGESIWMTGWDSTETPSAATMPLVRSTESWPPRLIPQAQGSGPADQDPGVFFVKSSPGKTLPVMQIDGSLHQTDVGPANRIVARGEIKFASTAPVVSATGGLAGSIYVVTGRSGSSILRLTPAR